MDVEIRTVDTQFLFWEYLFPIFGIGSLQCFNASEGIATKDIASNGVTFKLYRFLSVVVSKGMVVPLQVKQK